MPLSQLEALARDLIHYYLPYLKPVYNLRPSWLTWPVTGNRLELDIYLPEIKSAIESDGLQHGRFIAGMQKEFAAFERQQARDLYKLEECRRRGIIVYKLTIFDLTEQRFPTKLRQLIDTALANPSLAPAIHDQLYRTRLKLSAIPIPHELYAQAERLSRQKFRPPKAKRMTWWQRLVARFRSMKRV